MKRNWLQIFIAFVMLFSFAVSAQAAETFTLDPNHTYVLWHVSHFGYSNPSGKWLAEGTVVLDKDTPQNSKVNVTIRVADVVTGIQELDDHLRGKVFFDVAQFPIATFVSNKVHVTGKNSAKVEGTLTVHGVSKPVTLDITLNKAGVSPITNKMTVGFSGSTKLKRSDFGINTLLPGLGDEVKIDIQAEASKAT
jgi:polyisoprenoid-binding protein YceI